MGELPCGRARAKTNSMGLDRRSCLLYVAFRWVAQFCTKKLPHRRKRPWTEWARKVPRACARGVVRSACELDLQPPRDRM